MSPEFRGKINLSKPLVHPFGSSSNPRRDFRSKHKRSLKKEPAKHIKPRRYRVKVASVSSVLSFLGCLSTAMILTCHFFRVFLTRSMGRPAFLAVYRSVCVGLKRHFAFTTAVGADGCVNWLLMELFEKAVIPEAWPPCLGVTQHFRVIR